MPNVDYYVRMAEQRLCHNTHYFATEIAKIDNKFCVKIFKNKKIEDIETILIKCSNAIKTLIKNGYYNDVNIQMFMNKLE